MPRISAAQPLPPTDAPEPGAESRPSRDVPAEERRAAPVAAPTTPICEPDQAGQLPLFPEEHPLF
jgi:hypothetical protein